MRRCSQHQTGGGIFFILFTIGLAVLIGWAILRYDRARQRARITEFIKRGAHGSQDHLGLNSSFIPPDKIPRAFIETSESDSEYVVRARFPDNTAREVEVEVDKGRKLRMSVASQSQKKTWVNWLPVRITSRVRTTDSMKLADDASTDVAVERKDHELVIHIPKIGTPIPAE